MALLPTGSDVLLELRSPLLHITLQGRPCSSLPGPSLLCISCKEPFDLVYHGTLRPPPDAVDGCYRYQNDALPLLLCGERYSLIVESLSSAALTFIADDPVAAEGFDSGTILHGTLSPGWEAGKVRFSVFIDGECLAAFVCMLLPREAPLREAIEPMQNTLRRAAYGLIFAPNGHPYESFVPGSGVHEELWSFWCRFRAIESDFHHALTRIKANPHRGIVRVHRLLPPEKIKKTDRRTSHRLSVHPGDCKLLAPVNTVSFDNPENRDLLYRLDRLLQRLDSLSHTVPEAGKARKRLVEKCYHLFTDEKISPFPLQVPSSVLCYHPAYRYISTLFRHLDAPLYPGESDFLLPVRPLKDLYHDWCFIFLHDFLVKDCGMLPRNGLPLSRNAVVLSLLPKHRIDYLDPRTGAFLSLHITTEKTILLTRQSGLSALQVAFLPDLFYRPGLFSSTAALKEGKSPFQELPSDTVFYSLILYPDIPPAHKTLKTLKSGKTMALPLLPDWEGLLLKTLKALLLTDEKSNFLPSPLSRDTEEALKASDWKHRGVLVGALSNREQLRTALKYNFYHIPADRLNPDDLSCHTAAIYQSSHLFGSGAGIYYIGRIVQVCKVRRREIYQIPKNSDEPYIVFKVAAWERLPHPILPDREGLVHLMTTDFLLYHSKTVAGLRLQKERDFRLYSYLEKVGDRNCGFSLGLFRIVFTSDEILLFYNGSLANQYRRAAFSDLPGALFRRLQEDLDECEEEIASR